MIDKVYLALLIAASILLAPLAGVADTSPKTSKTYSVDFNSTASQGSSSPSLPVDEDDDFNVLFYRGGAALLIDPRSFINRADDIDQQIKQLDAAGTGYFICTRRDQEAVPGQHSGRTYSTNLKTMQRDGYDCRKQND